MSSAYNRKVCLGCKAPMFHKVAVSQNEGTGVRKIPGSVYVRFTVRINSKQADEAIKDGHFCAPCVAEGKASVFFDQCLELAAEHTHSREDQKRYHVAPIPEHRTKPKVPPKNLRAMTFMAGWADAISKIMK